MSRLESRCLLSTGSRSIGSFPDLREELPPPPPPFKPPTPPQEGGVFVQNGAVVDIVVGQPSGNKVQINSDGAGAYRAHWNGGPVHSLSGVQAVYVFTRRAKRDQITIDLTDPPRASPQVELHPGGRVDSGGTNTVAYRALRAGRAAVQNGAELTITVSKPTRNKVQILDQGGGDVEVEWNGSSVHSYTGITTILVRTSRARNDRIAFYTPSI
jgi:hypothetical protein